MPRKKQQVARKHHFISKGYLAQFTDTGKSDGRLCAFDLITGRYFRPKPADVGFELDFNRIDVDGEPPDALETAFGHFESRAILVIREICKTGKLPDMDAFSYVYNLITLFGTRNPLLRDNLKSAHLNSAQVLIELITSSPKMYEQTLAGARANGYLNADEHIPYDQVRSAVLSDALTLSVPRERLIGTELRSFEKVLEVVAQRYWSVMSAGNDVPDLITCDRPVSPQLGAEQIVLTISPRYAISGTIQPLIPTEFSMDIGLVARINSQVIAQASKQIYSRSNQIALFKDGKIVEHDLHSPASEQLRRR